ncbi:DUF3576 domain-containing protein [Candidatus Pelagibacter sp.]|nr:DUF3576 domain-containing protein [Candidatus Pelagibacter sp.]
MIIKKVSKITLKFFKISILTLVIPLMLSSCKTPDGKFKLPGGDARKNPANPAERVKKNLETGKGFQLNEMFESDKRGGVFDFASSNELWRASLDVIDFMPLSSVNYSGGIIITDWYSSSQNSGESIKISIRFLTNEIRSDALDIKVFNKQCINTINCKITESSGMVEKELKRKILKTATLYKEVNKNKKE